MLDEAGSPGRPHVAPTARPVGSGAALVAVASIALAIGVLGVAVAHAASTQPVYAGDFPDPYVTRGPTGTYYAYSTQVGQMNVPMMTSTDLATWATPIDALPRLPSWAAWGHTWAPAVARRGATWVMWYTTRHATWGIQCISLATAASPTGPFVDTSKKPFVCQRDHHGSIDPSPFVASDGGLYLHWKSDDNAVGGQTRLWAQQLSADGRRRVGAETVLLAYQAETWQDPLIEGPSMGLIGGIHHLFYGAGWWESAESGVGHAVCTGPLGPCTNRTVTAAWMAGDATKAGPAGPTLFSTDAGATWRIAYHAWEPGRVGYAVGGRRALWVDRVSFASGEPVVQ